MNEKTEMMADMVKKPCRPADRTEQRNDNGRSPCHGIHFGNLSENNG